MVASVIWRVQQTVETPFGKAESPVSRETGDSVLLTGKQAERSDIGRRLIPNGHIWKSPDAKAVFIANMHFVTAITVPRHEWRARHPWADMLSRNRT